MKSIQNGLSVLTLIIPMISYCDVIYSNLSVASKRILTVAFNSCVRFVYCLGRRDHVSNYVYRLLGCSFEDLFLKRLAIFMFNIIKTGKPAYLFNKLNFGHSQRLNNLISLRSHNSYGFNSILSRGVRLWSSLPSNLRSVDTLGQFRAKITRHFAATTTTTSTV